MLEWRLKAYRHWLTMKEHPGYVHYPPIDYQKIITTRPNRRRTPKKPWGSGSATAGDLQQTVFRSRNRNALPSAVDAVFDMFSGHHLQREAGGNGDCFLFFRAVREHRPGKNILERMVPYSTIFCHVELSVFSDGSFCYIPKGVRCPMELSPTSA